ncbi:MAG TPA: AgmX/PglI C-terminal domain-containing protein [Polyangiaceae bacterium]|jgi:hypothetical protein
MRTWRRLVTMGMVVVTAFLFYRWWQAASSRAQAPPRTTAATEDPDLLQAGGTRSGAGGAAPGEAASSESPSGPKLDRARADKMREEIRALLAEAGPLGLMGAASAEPAAARDAGFPTMPVLGVWDGGGPKVDPEYIRTRVHEDLFPLARNCYADALKRDPKLTGKLVVSFRIIGDKKVGGVVDDAKMTEDTTIEDAEMQTCVRESMMAVSFDAPPGDQEITVVYPIAFSPDDDDAGGG